MKYTLTMKKHSLLSFLFFHLFFVGPIGSHAQTSTLDSLENELKTSQQKDTTTINLLNRIALMVYQQDIEKTIQYAEKAKALSDSLNYPKGKAKYIYLQGIVRVVRSDFDQAISAFKQAYEAYQTIDGVSKADMILCFQAIAVASFYKNDYQQAANYARQTIALFEAIGDRSGVANTRNTLAVAYKTMGAYDSSLIEYRKALVLFEQMGNESGVSQCLNNMGILYEENGDHSRALENYMKSLTIGEKRGDRGGIANVSTNIGNVYLKLKNYDEALVFYKKGLKFQEDQQDRRGIARAKANIGSLYIGMNKYDSATSYLQQSLEESQQIGDKRLLAGNYINLADIQLINENYEKSRAYYELALSSAMEIENRREMAFAYLGIAKSYFPQKEYKRALEHAYRCEEITRKSQLKEIQMENDELLSKIHYAMGNYKQAHDRYTSFKLISDSLFNEKNVRKITQLEYQYKYEKELDEAAQKELVLTNQVAIKDRDLAESAKQRLFILIAFLILTIVLLVGFFRQKLSRSQSEKELALVEQKLLRSQMTPHFLFNSLSVLQGIILNKEHEKSIRYLSNFSRLLRLTLENSREKTVTLNNELIAIEKYLEVQNLNADFPLTYRITVEGVPDKAVLKIPPMMIQPFVENAVEHGFGEEEKEKELTIAFRMEKEKLTCTIMDNGKGIDSIQVKAEENKKSLSTTITRERLVLLAKEFKVPTDLNIKDRKSVGEKGTMVMLTLPYKTT
ncbi:MAG: tetratricopeptide repeat protein [Bacteroidota bacterium]